jgi:hypothetical protein
MQIGQIVTIRTHHRSSTLIPALLLKLDNNEAIVEFAMGNVKVISEELMTEALPCHVEWFHAMVEDGEREGWRKPSGIQ